MLKKCLLLLIFFSIFPLTTYAVTTIYFWHSMGGKLGIIINHMAQQFNDSHKQYKIIPVFKGAYSDTLTATVAAFRAHQQPALVQVFEVGTATMINPKGVVVPIYKLMQETGQKLNAQEFIPTVAQYYSDNKGRLLAMPFNSSSAVLFYNKDAFKKAGLNPNNPPKTWPELASDARKIVKMRSSRHFFNICSCPCCP